MNRVAIRFFIAVFAAIVVMVGMAVFLQRNIPITSIEPEMIGFSIWRPLNISFNTGEGWDEPQKVLEYQNRQTIGDMLAEVKLIYDGEDNGEYRISPGEIYLAIYIDEATEPFYLNRDGEIVADGKRYLPNNDASWKLYDLIVENNGFRKTK